MTIFLASNQFLIAGSFLWWGITLIAAGALLWWGVTVLQWSWSGIFTIGIGIVINTVSTLLLFTIVRMMEVALSSEYTFSYGIGWLIWLTGIVMFSVSIYKKPAAS